MQSNPKTIRLKLKSGDEYAAFTKERKHRRVKAGKRKAVKRRHNKRKRRTQVDASPIH